MHKFSAKFLVISVIFFYNKNILWEGYLLMINCYGQLVFLSDLSVIQIVLILLISIGVMGLLIYVLRKMFAPQKMVQMQNAVKKGNYRQAIKIGQELLQKDRNNPEVHYLIAESLYAQNKFKEALAEYINTTNRLSESHIIKFEHLHERLAELYLKENNLEEASKEYLELYQKNPNNFDYCFSLAELSEKRRKYEMAAKYYMASLKLKSTNVPALVSLGVLLASGRKFQDAEKLLSKAVRLDPTNGKALYYYGLCKKNTDDKETALRLFLDASRDKEFKAKSLIERGLILLEKEKYEDAIAEMQRALKNLDNTFANRSTILNLHYTLANCYETIRDITNAIKELEAIKKISPAYKDVPARLAGYEALRMGDEMKDFMTAADDKFISICKDIVSSKMKMSINNAEMIKRDVVQIIGTDNDKKWMNIKQRPEIIRFYRINTPVTERELHDALDFARKRDATKSVILSSSSFSQTALTFAQERPIQLMDKTALASLICDKK